LKLGEYPSLKLAEARDRALKARGQLADRRDPITEQKRAREPEPAAPAAFTFADFVPAFVAFQRGRKKTWEDDEAAINKHLLPAWRTVPLKDITRRMIHERPAR